jgi:cell division transport system permease protein
MFLSFIRALKFSLQDISRNVWLSIATITILILTMFSINTLILTRAVSDNAVEAIKEKIDLSVYLKSDAMESEIFELRNKINSLDRVRSVTYVSKQDALDSFRDRNKNNPEVMQALVELGRNPLSPSLIISPQDMDAIPDLIEELKFMESSIIESRDFSDNSLMLEKINNITDRIDEIGLLIISIFIFTTLLVIYNSIKVAVYTHKKEVEVMRLVGASNSFIYAPFLLSSLIYTLIATVIIISLLFPLLGILQPYLEVFFVGYNINIISYFVNNFWMIFGLQFLGISLINIMASYLAVKKHSKI